VRELAKITKLNPNTVIKFLKYLEEKKLILKETKMHVVEFWLNLNNKDVIWKKKLNNLQNIFSSGILDYLVKYYSPKSISLIGSYSRGEDIENSDIDFIIVSNETKIADVSKFEKMFSRKIHLLSIRDKISEELFNNLINGTLLYGFVRGKPS
jgi:predicted nucleotidyltransferase